MLNTTSDVTINYLVQLVYELLDAHADTVDLASMRPADITVADWAAHVDYLQGLQRVGREALARVPQPIL